MLQLRSRIARMEMPARGCLMSRGWFQAVLGACLLLGVVGSPALALDPAASLAAPAAPTSEAAVVWVNARFREPLAIPALRHEAPLALAAERHAAYYAVNGYSAHSETPGRPGFTGEEPGARCAAAGVGFSRELPGGGLSVLSGCGEIASSSSALDHALPLWAATPYHGDALFIAEQFGFGSSSGGAVGNWTWFTELPIGFDPVAAVNTPASPVRIWPFEGAVEVPVSWAGGETPDPLRNYTGDRRNVGPVFFIVSFLGRARVELVDESGRGVPLLRPGGTVAESTVDLEGGVGAYAAQTTGVYNGLFPLFAATALSGGSRYRIIVTDPATGVVRQTSFATASATPTIIDDFRGRTPSLPAKPRLLGSTRTRTTVTARWRLVPGAVRYRVWSRVGAARPTVRFVRGNRVAIRGRPGKRLQIVISGVDALGRLGAPVRLDTGFRSARAPSRAERR